MTDDIFYDIFISKHDIAIINILSDGISLYDRKERKRWENKQNR